MRTILVPCSMALLLGTSDLAASTWTGLSSQGNVWSQRRNWALLLAPANDGTADIRMAGGVRPQNEADGPWSINSLTFDGTTTPFDISGASLTIEDGIRNDDPHTHEISARILTAGGFEVDAAAGPLLFTDTVTLNGSTKVVGSNPVAFVHLDGTGGISFDGPDVRLHGTTSNTHAGAMAIDDGTTRFAKSGQAEAVTAVLRIGDDKGAPGSALLRLDNHEQITSEVGRRVIILCDGELDLAEANETIRDLELNGGVVSGQGTLEIDGRVECIGNGPVSTISAPVRLGSPTEFDVRDGVLPEDALVDGDILAGAIRKTGDGTLVVDARFAADTTYVDAGRLVVIYDDIAFPPGSAIVVGDGVIAADGDPADILQFEHTGQLDPSVPVTIESSGRLVLGAVQTIDQVTMNGGSMIAGGVTFERLDAADHAFVNTCLWLDGTSVVDVAPGPAEFDLIIAGCMVGPGTLQKEGGGTLKLEASQDFGQVHAICLEGELRLDPFIGAPVLLHGFTVGGPCPGDALVRFRDDELTSGGDWTVDDCGHVDVDGTRQNADVITMNGGLLDIDGGHVIADALSAVSHATIDLGDGGILELTSSLDFAGVLRGSGTIVIDFEMINDGLMSPGASPGTIVVDADLRQPAGGAMHLEIGGTDPAQYDHVDATGDVVLEGGTITVEFIDGFEPAPGDAFPLVTGATMTVGDVEVIAPDGYGVNIESGVLELVENTCVEDLDGSGTVGFGDIIRILGAWGNAGGPEDLDGSGVVGFGDILVILAAWGPCT